MPVTQRTGRWPTVAWRTRNSTTFYRPTVGNGSRMRVKRLSLLAWEAGLVSFDVLAMKMIGVFGTSFFGKQEHTQEKLFDCCLLNCCLIDLCVHLLITLLLSLFTDLYPRCGIIAGLSRFVFGAIEHRSLKVFLIQFICLFKFAFCWFIATIWFIIELRTRATSQ